MQRLAKPLDAIRASYDVVVIGSGYGGGVSASRLARAGQRVCVLERGREYLTGEFPSRFPDLRKELMVTGGRFGAAKKPGLYDFRYGEHIHVLTGCGVGGGSLINAGVSLRPDPRVFADPTFPAAFRLDGDRLDEAYERARLWIRPVHDPATARMTKHTAFEAASRGMPERPESAPVAVSFTDTTSAAGIAQQACTRCGDCCGGCNVGAKNTVALSYLPDAIANGAELFAEVKVLSVARDGSRWRIDFRPMDGKAGDQPAGSVAADIVVIAAGTLGSTELLLRSRERGLAVSDTIGSRFSANGDIIAFGYNGRERVHAIGIGHPAKAGLAEVGAAVTAEIAIRNDGDLDHEMWVQEGVLPSALGPLLPMMFVPGGKLLGAAEALIRGVYEGPLSRTHTFFVVSHDSAGGRVVLKDGAAAVDWAGVNEEPFLLRVDSMLASLCAGNGASYVKSPLATAMLGQRPATAHPLGGAPMGEDAGGGVVDHKGRVFDPGKAGGVHAGLYVSDGSVIPRSLGVNPLLTITALAERAMMDLAEDYQLRFDASARVRVAAR